MIAGAAGLTAALAGLVADIAPGKTYHTTAGATVSNAASGALPPLASARQLGLRGAAAPRHVSSSAVTTGQGSASTSPAAGPGAATSTSTSATTTSAAAPTATATQPTVTATQPTVTAPLVSAPAPVVSGGS